jgi:hypothetical protein
VTATPDRSTASQARATDPLAPARPADEAGVEAAAEEAVCSRCGGALIAGAFVLPILGRAKFAYDLRGRSIETDVDARMCSDCGLLTLNAEDPERIRRAYKAERYAEAATDGTARLARRGPSPRVKP